MIRRIFTFVLLLTAINVVSLPALASKGEEDEGPINARLMGYDKSYEPAKANVMVVIMVWLALAGAGVAVMFKNAKRTHLD
jgi:hypothetical protein